MLSTVERINAIGGFDATEADLGMARRNAASQLERMAGDDLYADVLADVEHEAREAFTDAECALAVMHYLPTKNMHAQGVGIVKTTTCAEGQVSLMTPADIDNLQETYLRMAETAVAPWITVVSAPPVRVGEVDEPA
ncbi:MAG: hypothetical protein K8R90_05200 [Candidatus Cloacimonetes bacterium]|nr:hypothetical protein [Candidatus Cloacimonadota bacterium]